jgi:hypothetical protein
MTRRAAPDPLFLTEGEIADRLGLPAVEWQAAASVLERVGLPRPDPVFRARRYWPAVRAFLDRRAGLRQDGPAAVVDGEEHWDDRRGRAARARA